MTACTDKPSQGEGIVTITQPTAQTPGLSAGAIAASPSGSGVLSTTIYTFQYVTPPTGGTPPYTFSWKFGDGTEAAGNTAVHTYASTGDFVVVATVTDSKGATSTATAPVSVRSVTGRWAANIGSGLDADRIVLIQNGTAVTGTINSTNNFGLGIGDGAVSNPRSLTVTIKFDNPPKDSGGTPLHDPAAITYRGTLDESLLTWTGTVSGYSSCPCSFTATRPSTTAAVATQN